MNTSIIIRYMERNVPRLYWRLRRIADAKGITLHELVIHCLVGETTHKNKPEMSEDAHVSLRPKGETTQVEGGVS